MPKALSASLLTLSCHLLHFLSYDRRRIELVQDLEFPAACHRLKLTPDGEYLFATGIHPPRVCPAS